MAARAAARTGLHVEQAAAGQEAAGGEIGPGQLLGRIGGVPQPLQQSVAQRFGIGREPAQIRVIIEMARCRNAR